MKEILLTQGKVALVDDENYGCLSRYKWFASKPGGSRTFYALRKASEDGMWKTVFMHRIILGIDDGIGIDHIDGNGLNNTRVNLRVAGVDQNQWNRQKTVSSASSQYKGVSWHKTTGKWQANIRENTRCTHLGLFEKEIEAALAYNNAAVKCFGEFARPNVIRQALLEGLEER